MTNYSELLEKKNTLYLLKLNYRKRKTTMRRKIIELKIFINEEKGVFESTLNRKCNKYDAMNIIQQFVDRHRKGESIDGEPETSTQK